MQMKSSGTSHRSVVVAERLAETELRGEARQGGSPDPALTIRVPLADFVRVLTTAGSFYPLILDGRMTMEGDLGLASRMSEMFGGRSAY